MGHYRVALKPRYAGYLEKRLETNSEPRSGVGTAPGFRQWPRQRRRQRIQPRQNVWSGAVQYNPRNTGAGGFDEFVRHRAR